MGSDMALFLDATDAEHGDGFDLHQQVGTA